jgi:hypothetical protein
VKARDLILLGVVVIIAITPIMFAAALRFGVI